MKRKYAIILIMTLIVSLFAGCGAAEEPAVPEGTTIDASNRDQYLNEFQISFNELEPVEGEVPDTIKNAGKSEAAPAAVYEMPDVTAYDFDVKGNGDIDAEIFLPENNEGVRKVVGYAAQRFNDKKMQNENGQTISVSVRCLESTLAEDFIKTGTYVPDGYIADNELLGYFMEANGIDVDMIAPKTVGNVIGIAVDKGAYETLKSKNESIDVKTIVQANIDGDLSIGYTNPLTSPTGLNFVVSMLATFDATNPNSMEASTDFSEFQNSVNSVSYSTDQMIKAVKSGTINSFVIDHQTYSANESLKEGFEFIPFGVRHDYPVYKMADTEEAEAEVLKAFADSFSDEDVIQYAKECHFFEMEDYVSNVDPSRYPASTLSEILSFWKENKAAGKKLVCIFACDISGSMNGKKLDSLLESMKSAAQYINEDSYVGILGFDHEVYQVLPVGKFDDKQKEYYFGAIGLLEDESGGGTATNDALIAAYRTIRAEESRSSEEIKPVIIVLSDGQTESGYGLNSVKPVLKAYPYPIYTIAYGKDADTEELQRIADINGGVFVNSTTGDIGYLLKNIFSAEF